MTIEAQLPDGRVLEFPDGTPTSVIQATVKRLLAPAAPTVGGQVKEAFKGLVPGAVGMLETAAIGASSLLPDQYEAPVRAAIGSAAGAAKAPFAAAPGYEETVGRKLGEAGGSILPFLALGPAGVAGRLAAASIGVGAGAGEARVRAEQGKATDAERAAATALGTIPGALEVFAPFRILGRLPDEITGGGVQLVKRALTAGGEEAAQEAASGFAQNLIAKGIYKPEQELIEGLGEQAAYGGAVGAIAQGVLDLALGRRARGAPSTEADQAELEAQRAREAEREQAPVAPPVPPAPTEETYASLVQARELLRQTPETPGSKELLKALDQRIQALVTEDVTQRQTTAAQTAREAEMASQSAFAATEPQQIEMGGMGVPGTLPQEPAPAEPVAPTAKELEEAGQGRLPLRRTPAGQPTTSLLQEPVVEDEIVAPAATEDIPEPTIRRKEEPPVPEGILSMGEGSSTLGWARKSYGQKFIQKVNALTPDQVEAFRASKKELPRDNSVASTAKREIFDAIYPEPSATPAGADVRPEPTAGQPAAEPSVGVPVPSEPQPADTELAQPSDGAGVGAVSGPVGAEPVPAGAPTAAVTPSPLAIDQLLRGGAQPEPAVEIETETAAAPPPPAPKPRSAFDLPTRSLFDPAREAEEPRAERGGVKVTGRRYLAATKEALKLPTKPAQTKKGTYLQRRAAFAKALGAVSQAGGNYLRGRANPKVAQAVVDGNWSSLTKALAASKNQIVARVGELGAKLKNHTVRINPDAREIREVEARFQSDTAYMAAAQIELLDKLRALQGASVEKLFMELKGPNEAYTAFVRENDPGSTKVYSLLDSADAMLGTRTLMWPPGKAADVYKTVQAAVEADVAKIGEERMRSNASAAGRMTVGVVAGSYNPSERAVEIASEYNAKDETTVAHEVAHAVLSDMVSNPTPAKRPIVANLNKLYEHVKRVLDAKGKTPYGTSSVQEFVAEGLANPDFQFELSEIEYQGKTAWGKFTQLMANLLGLPANNALAEFLAVTEALTEGPMGKQTGKGPTLLSVQPNPRAQALQIVQDLGNETPVDPTAKEQMQAIYKDVTQNPLEVVRSSKDSLRNVLNTFGTNVWSSDFAFQANMRRALEQAGMTMPEITDFMLRMSTAQASNADAVATNALVAGAAKYDPETGLAKVVKSDNNVITLAQSLQAVAKKLSVTINEAERMWHTVTEAERLQDISRFNNEVETIVSQLESKGRRAEANEQRKRVKVVHRTPAEIATALQLYDIVPELRKTTRIWNAFKGNILDFMVDSGTMTRDMADDYIATAAYVPLYRIDQIEGNKGPREYMSGLMVGRDPKFKGSYQPVNDVFDNVLRWAQFAVEKSVRNNQARKMVEGLESIGAARPAAGLSKEALKRGEIVTILKDGVRIPYQSDLPGTLTAFSGLESVSIPALKYFSQVADVLRQSIVLFPLFPVLQVPQDAFAAMFTSGLKPRYALTIPARAIKEFIKTLRNTSQTHKDLKKYAAVGRRDVTSAVRRNDLEVAAGLKASPGVKGYVLDKLHHISMASDSAVRQAVYEASMAQGLSKSEAIQKSFDLINFRYRGTSKLMSLASQTIPFFNAYSAATYVAFKTLTGQGISPTARAEAGKTFAQTFAVTAALSLIYAIMIGDDEDYQNTPDRERDRSLMIPGTGIGIPLRPDIFLLPKVLAEQTYQLLLEEGTSDPAKFRAAMTRLLADTVLSPTAVPQAIKPLLEVGINYNFFTGRPLVGPFEQQKAASLQFNESTSELSKAFSATLGMDSMAPVKVDHLIRGLTGSVGAALLWGTNQIMDPVYGGERADITWRDAVATFPGMGAVVRNTNETGLKTDFYELREATRKAHTTYLSLEANMPQLLENYVMDPKIAARLELASTVEDIGAELTALRQYRQGINADTNLTGEEKQKQLQELADYERELLESADLRGLRTQAQL